MRNEVAVFNAHRRYRIRKKPVIRYVQRVLKQTKEKNARVSVVFVDSRSSRALNRRYLKHDDVTDVISFPLHEASNLEGEIYVNLDKARQQARQYGVTFTNELARLVIHGVLHLVGFDDGNREDASHMKRVEDDHVRHWFPEATRIGSG